MMKTKFKVGDVVECVSARGGEAWKLIIINTPYSVTKVKKLHGRYFLYLKGISKDLGFCADCFAKYSKEEKNRRENHWDSVSE